MSLVVVVVGVVVHSLLHTLIHTDGWTDRLNTCALNDMCIKRWGSVSLFAYHKHIDVQCAVCTYCTQTYTV